jgi:hypothetical protein
VSWLHAVIDVPGDRYAAASAFWAGATGWAVGGPWAGHPELRSLEPPQGRAYLHLQQVDARPGVHVDLEADDVDATAARAVELGASYVAEQDRWRTLRSPGGLPFCVVSTGRDDPPGPVTWPGGLRTRPVQVCVDSPRDVHDDEVAFWRALLGHRWVPGGSPEFAGKWHDDAGSPLQLLFQRLGEPTGPVRAHLDLGTDDVEADARRLLALGAEDIGPGRGWHAMRDAAGLAFCTTGNSPEQRRRRDIG